MATVPVVLPTSVQSTTPTTTAGMEGSSHPNVTNSTNSPLGIGNGTSSLVSSSNTPPLVGSFSTLKPSSGSALLTDPNSLPSSSTPVTTARSSKVVQNDSAAPDPNRALITVQMKISRIFQRFLVRCPHALIAMGMVFFTLHYGFGKESLAYSAATFVGVGGTVHCLTRAIFLEAIPNWMLPNNADTRKWRNLMNITYTAFITVIFTSAVWKLPDLSAAQGFCFFTLSFGIPYPFLANFYPDIDKQPSYTQQKWG